MKVEDFNGLYGVRYKANGGQGWGGVTVLGGSVAGVMLGPVNVRGKITIEGQMVRLRIMIQSEVDALLVTGATQAKDQANWETVLLDPDCFLKQMPFVVNNAGLTGVVLDRLIVLP